MLTIKERMTSPGEEVVEQDGSYQGCDAYPDPLVFMGQPSGMCYQGHQ